MGSGYHSRSPEEFKKYMDSLGNKGKKRNWKQIILFVDVLLLLMVFYMIFRALNPEATETKQSTKQIVEGSNSYLSLSREVDLDYQGYFWFFENASTLPLSLPGKEWKVEFRILTREGKVCFREPIDFPAKKIPPESKDFLYYSISLAKLYKLPEDCRKEIFDIEKSFFRSRYKALELGFFAEMDLETPNQKWQFSIKQKPYPNRDPK